jgi:hypothetical protein
VGISLLHPDRNTVGAIHESPGRTSLVLPIRPGDPVKYKILPRGPFVNGPYSEIPVYELSEPDTHILFLSGSANQPAAWVSVAQSRLSQSGSAGASAASFQ